MRVLCLHGLGGTGATMWPLVGALGILAGYFRGRFESVVVGSMDVLLAFPPLVLRPK